MNSYICKISFLKHLNLSYDLTIVDNDDVDTANTEPINPEHLKLEKNVG